MAFYVVRNQADGTYLSLYGAKAWVLDVREAAVFTQRTTATRSIRQAWQGFCVVERISRLPDRIRPPARADGRSMTPRLL